MKNNKLELEIVLNDVSIGFLEAEYSIDSIDETVFSNDKTYSITASDEIIEKLKIHANV